jgi:hypothetical protein
MNRISNKANTQKLNTKNKNFQSTGNLFLDKIINGISLGTIVLLVQDNPTDIYQTFVKYFVSEGIVNEQKIFFYYTDDKIVNSIVKNLPYKSTQVESILNAKRVTELKTGSSSEMKIAWRYENIKYSNLLEEIASNSSYIFDLSRQLQDTYLIEKNKDIITFKEIDSENPAEILEILNKNLIKDYQNYASGFSEDDTNKYVRIVFPDIFGNVNMGTNLSHSEFEKLKSKIKLQLNVLKNLARSINGITYLTVNKEFVNKDIFNLLFYFSDYVFSLQSFLLDPQKLEDYDGLFTVNKLPRLLSFKTFDLETDVFGIKVEKRKVIIEKIDIGVEVDRNTKVKEKDISASQAICGHDKYSKDYEF